MHIETPGERSSELVAALVDVWERSVRATHDFLAEDDIVGLRPEAESGGRPARRRRPPAKTEGGWGKTRENFFSWSKKCGIMYPDMIWPGVGRNFRGK